MNNESIQLSILDWYSKNKRDLAWRKTNDPYRIAVSEMMLQQTQVPRVVVKYREFLLKFPTVFDLAHASPAQVIDAWAGLGYNRRALHLHQFAKEIVDKFGGNVPSDRDTLMGLSGIGPYTSQAIRCFGFGIDVAVVDINIKRIYSRVFFCGEGSYNELDNIARELVPSGNAVAWNNALMDFGSLVCADSPRCDICPIRDMCKAFATGTPQRYVKPKMQSKFIGSDRFYRSAIVKHLLAQADFTSDFSVLKKIKPADKTDEWFESVIDGLKRDGLIVERGAVISLPR